ncbi:KilA-N domain-containing protein, partial [uncultured Microscilla sp.]|uniref:KilA-N domain-containing protein n=1 Tax=uncultured Microscilla sp. TaxID=432653 RepID=UPI00260AD998
MKTTNLMIQSFGDSKIVFTEQGWINATATCKAFGKNGLDNYLRSKQFIEYAQVVAVSLQYDDFMDLKKTKEGRWGGTFLHPKLVFEFARWISPMLAFWCNERMVKRLKPPEIAAKITWLEQRMDCIEQDKQWTPLFVDTRSAVERLVKNYATATQMPIEDIYQLLYERFTLIYKQSP